MFEYIRHRLFDEPRRPKNPNLYVRLADSAEAGFFLIQDGDILTTEAGGTEFLEIES